MSQGAATDAVTVDMSFQTSFGGNGEISLLDDHDQELFFDGDENTIALSSDDEDEASAASQDDDDVQLVVVRPKSKSMLVRPEGGSGGAGVDCNDMSKEPQMVGSYSGNSVGLSLQEKTGYVKEYVDPASGLGILFSMDCGLVLFHLEVAWVDGRQASIESAVHGELQPGTNVSFYECYVEGSEFEVVSKEGFFRQAAAVWSGARPDKVLRVVKTAQHTWEMENHRRDFLAHVTAERFLHVPLTRARGKITGYLSEEIGLIEFRLHPNADMQMAVFRTRDAHVYGKKAYKLRDPVWKSVPAGINVIFDARNMNPAFRGVKYQVLALFAGSWPAVPHPTLLPGGPGSDSQCYATPSDGGKHSFYYLNLQLAEEMDAEWKAFKRHSDRYGTELMRTDLVVESSQDYYMWQNYYAPVKIQQRGPRTGNGSRKRKSNYHEFKRQPPRPAESFKKIKEEEHVVIKLEPLNHVAVKPEPQFH